MSKIQQLHNWPRDPKVRRLIIPDQPDHVLAEFDLSQAEARVVAWYAKEHTLMELFRSGAKVHEFVGSMVMGQKITKKTHPILYETSKRIVHGSNYGMAPKRIASVILEELEHVESVQQCTEWQNRYFQQFPMIKSGFHAGIENELRQNLRVLETPPLKLTRKFYNPWGNDLFRQAYAHYPQAVVGWITNNALNELYYDTWLQPYIRMQIHDSILLSVPKSRLLEAKSLVVKAMTKTIDIKGDMLTIPVETKIGPNWGEMKDYVG